MTITEEQNKAFVLHAFDTLFNKRDYAAAVNGILRYRLPLRA